MISYGKVPNSKRSGTFIVDGRNLSFVIDSSNSG